MADFDNSLLTQDTQRRFPGLYYRGHGVEEGILTGGDGGGTTFLPLAWQGAWRMEPVCLSEASIPILTGLMPRPVLASCWLE